MDSNVAATKLTKSALGKRRRTTNVSPQDDDESDDSAQGPETRSTLSLSAALSDDSDVF